MNAPFNPARNFGPAMDTWKDPQRVETLKTLWADGLSASQIAAETDCGLSRSAVIGKVHRLKLPKRKQGQSPKPRKVPTPHGRFVRLSPTRHRTKIKMNPAGGQYEVVSEFLEAPVIEDAAIPVEQRRTIANLGASDCRWPVGDPQSNEFFYCGAEAVKGCPYCAGHMARAYQPRRSKDEMSEDHIKFLNGEYRRKAAWAMEEADRMAA